MFSDINESLWCAKMNMCANVFLSIYVFFSFTMFGQGCCVVCYIAFSSWKFGQTCVWVERDIWPEEYISNSPEFTPRFPPFSSRLWLCLKMLTLSLQYSNGQTPLAELDLFNAKSKKSLPILRGNCRSCPNTFRKLKSLCSDWSVQGLRWWLRRRESKACCLQTDDFSQKVTETFFDTNWMMEVETRFPYHVNTSFWCWC